MQHIRLAADLAIFNVILFRTARGIHDRDIPLTASGTLKSAFHENIISEGFENPETTPISEACRAALIRAALCYTKKRLRDILPLLIVRSARSVHTEGA
jgi:hypothetical protein